MHTELETFAIAASASEAPHAFGITPDSVADQRGVALLELARQFLSAIEADTKRSGDDFTSTALAFYADDVLQEEFPNRFVTAGAQRDLQALREAGKRGKSVMRAQRFEPRKAYAIGDTVVLEVLWVGTLALNIGALQAGDEMRAHFAVFLEYRGDKILRHRTYDCFEAF